MKLEASVRVILNSPFRWIGAAFLVAMILLPQMPGENEEARLATMAALVSQHTFAITTYPWTLDWAQSPVNGNLYSNKPPGPVILGTPIFWLIDQAPSLSTRAVHESTRIGQRFQDRHIYNHVVSIAIQAIPFVMLVLFISSTLINQGYSVTSVHFGVISMLFGTTASIMMNSYFGHGVAALFVLGAAFSVMQKKYAIAGLCMGIAVLSDYGAALLTIPFLLGIGIQEGKQAARSLARVVLGAFTPALIWITYHWTIFGHPLHIASRFSNPIFFEESSFPLWGLFSTTSSLRILGELLVGSERGLLVTQPWVLLTTAFAFTLLFSKKHLRSEFFPLVVFSIGGLMLLLAANSSFSGWHSGWIAGPRYVSSVLPLFGLLAAMMYDHLARIIKVTLWLGLVLPIALFIVTYSTSIFAPNGVPLWHFYTNQLSHSTGIQPFLNIGGFTMLLLLVMIAPVKQYGRSTALTASVHTPQTHLQRSSAP